VIPAAVLVLMLATSVEPPEPPDVAPKSFVIVRSTTSYDEARAVAVAAAEQLAFRLNLRELAPDTALGLTFPEDDCKNEFGSFPCYVPRGRWDDGVYVSVEHTSSYEGFEEGFYIVVLASGSPRDRNVRAALRRAKTAYPEASIRTTPIYLGCIH